MILLQNVTQPPPAPEYSTLVVWGSFLAIIAISVLVGLIFERVVLRSVRKIVASSKSNLDDLVLKAIHPAVLVLLVVAGVWVGLNLLGTGIPPQLVGSIGRITFAVIVFLVALILARFFAALLQYKAQQQWRYVPAANLGRQIGSILIYFLALLIVLDQYGVSVTPLLTSLGIAGIAVALALQDTLSNFFAGVWLQTGRAIQPGHFIRMEAEKIDGHVVEISWRTTRLRTLGNNMIIVPNAKLAQALVTDYHMPTPRMSIHIPVRVGYETDSAHVERILIEEAKAAAKEFKGILEEPPPLVRCIPGFMDFSVEYDLVCQVREYTDQFEAQNQIRRRILVRFRKENIRIPTAPPQPVENVPIPEPPTPPKTEPAREPT